METAKQYLWAGVVLWIAGIDKDLELPVCYEESRRQFCDAWYRTVVATKSQPVREAYNVVGRNDVVWTEPAIRSYPALALMSTEWPIPYGFPVTVLLTTEFLANIRAGTVAGARLDEARERLYVTITPGQAEYLLGDECLNPQGRWVHRLYCKEEPAK